jgi:hypothetical protein
MMYRLSPILAWVGGAAAMSLAWTASATTLIYKDFNQLISQAQAVVTATVDSQKAVRNANGNIVTLVTLRDLVMEKGGYTGQRLTLQIAGGQFGDEYEGIEGAPRFKVGEQYILFVQNNGTELVPLVGWEQGAFHVATGAQGQKHVEYNNGRDVLAIQGGHVVAEPGHDERVAVVGAPGQMHKTTSPQANAPAPEGSAADASLANKPLTVGATHVSAPSPMSHEQFVANIRNTIALQEKSSPIGVVGIVPEVVSIREEDITKPDSPYLWGRGVGAQPPASTQQAK